MNIHEAIERDRARRGRRRTSSRRKINRRARELAEEAVWAFRIEITRALLEGRIDESDIEGWRPGPDSQLLDIMRA